MRVPGVAEGVVANAARLVGRLLDDRNIAICSRAPGWYGTDRGAVHPAGFDEQARMDGDVHGAHASGGPGLGLLDF
jgi:hypothetical protein